MSTENAVQEAQAPGTFDVLSFVEGTAYPTDTVVIYQDVKSVTDLLNANNRRLEMDKSEKTGDYTEIDAEIAELTEKVKASAMSFYLRGMPPGVSRTIFNATDDTTDAQYREMENELIAKTIVRVTNAAGASDERLWDGETVAKLRDFVKEGEFRKLVTAVANVNFNAMVFDQATDAGFLS